MDHKLYYAMSMDGDMFVGGEVLSLSFGPGLEAHRDQVAKLDELLLSGPWSTPDGSPEDRIWEPRAGEHCARPGPAPVIHLGPGSKSGLQPGEVMRVLWNQLQEGLNEHARYEAVLDIPPGEREAKHFCVGERIWHCPACETVWFQEDPPQHAALLGLEIPHADLCIVTAVDYAEGWILIEPMFMVDGEWQPPGGEDVERVKVKLPWGKTVEG